MFSDDKVEVLAVCLCKLFRALFYLTLLSNIIDSEFRIGSF